MKEPNRLRNIVKIISCCNSDIPLRHFLSNFYRQNKQMGSSDRKLTSLFVYNYFRLGKALSCLSTEERIAVAGFLCCNRSNPLLEYCFTLYPAFHVSALAAPLQEKINFITTVYPQFCIDEVFPFPHLLSEGIDQKKYALSFLIQPKLWIRIRKQYSTVVLQELKSVGICYETDTGNDDTLSFSNGTSLTQLSSYQKGYFEIQDKLSQQTGDFFNPQSGEHWWDCCAGSGGKSLMLIEKNNKIQIRMTDIRESILKNCRQRMEKAGFKNFTVSPMDVSLQTQFSENNMLFDGIIVDAPCSGSGTWARTPESIAGFDENSLHKFSELQQSIIQNTATLLKPGAPLIYITCSVFKQENEEVVDFCSEKHHLHLEKNMLLKGYEQAADSMFVAVMRKFL